MKKTIWVIVLLLLLVGCNSNNNKKSKKTTESTTSTAVIEKELTEKQKERLVKLTEEELKKNKIEYDTKDSKWIVELKKEKSKKKWIVIKQDAKVKEIKAVFEWDGKNKTVPKLISLLVDGKEPTEPKKEQARTETSSINDASTISPSQFIGNWYQVGGGAEIIFTETTSNNSENSEVTQEGKYTKFMHNGQPQADIKCWIYKDANLGEVLEVTYIHSGLTLGFSRLKEQQKEIQNQKNQEELVPNQQSQPEALKPPYNPETLFEAQVEKAKQEIRNYFSERTVDSTGQPYRHIDATFDNVFNFISPYKEPYVYANSDEELLSIISPLFEEYKQKVINKIIDDNNRLSGKNE